MKGAVVEYLRLVFGKEAGANITTGSEKQKKARRWHEKLARVCISPHALSTLAAVLLEDQHLCLWTSPSESTRTPEEV